MGTGKLSRTVDELKKARRLRIPIMKIEPRGQTAATIFGVLLGLGIAVGAGLAAIAIVQTVQIVQSFQSG
jgi:hypothetical protein